MCYWSSGDWITSFGNEALIMLISLDHIAFRLKDKQKALSILSLFKFEKTDSFEIDFGEEKAECIVAENPNVPEIFMSDGQGVVGGWVEKNGQGVHHIAFKTSDIEGDVKELKSKGIEFTSEILECDDLKQIFTKPIQELGGVTIELIERNTKGFCSGNVKKLMESTNEK
jgi:methylmalonyl-CoA/ethylmalonyl-CoA epimerase